MSTGIEAIAAERQRQIDAEGWTPEHDDLHGRGEIAAAASCYAMHDLDIGADWRRNQVRLMVREPKSRRENLVRAGALIAAAIDSIDRAENARINAEGWQDAPGRIPDFD